MTSVSLVDGWLYTTLLVLGVVAFLYLLIRHDWTTAVNGISHTLPWAATQMGLTA